MKLMLATNHLGLGGSESYLLTVAEQFDRLGHEVVVYTPEPGDGVQVAQARGIEVVEESGLSGDFDAALVQDSGISYQIADRCPGVPQLFVAHSEMFDLQAPPQLDGVACGVVALNDRVARRMRSFAARVEVMRLRQPIDTEHFRPRGPLPQVARSALLLSNTLHVDRAWAIEAACSEAGIDLEQLGGISGHITDVRAALARAEIVIGYGRSILEAMACGRAAYVYDWNGGDGWVTAESYPAIEADGFAGRSGRMIIEAARLADDLHRYTPSMGSVNHDLVMAHHRANLHAQELLELFDRMAQSPRRPLAPLQEMARLVRLEWRAQADVRALVQENVDLHKVLAAEAESARRAWKQAAIEKERVGETVRAYELTRSWRLTRPLRTLGHIRRRLFRRGDRRGRSPAGYPDSGATMNGAGSPPPSRAGDREKAHPSAAR